MTKADGSLCISILCIAFNVVKPPNEPSLRHAWTNGESGQLEIFPNGETISKASGTQMMLTCRPRGENPELVNNMQWRDPLDRVVETQAHYASSGYADPKMYTIPLRPDGSLTLVFAPLTEELAGRYTCVAIYASTETLNKTVTVETIDAISFKDAPAYQYPILGKEFKIKCQVSARPAPSVTWQRGPEVISTNDHYIIETHALKINKVELSDEGAYTCRAEVISTGEYKDRIIQIEVHEPPVIEEKHGTIEIIEGRNADIECIARGKPPPDYSWIEALTKKNLSIADRFSVDGRSGILTITNVQRTDAGEYQCIASNAAGEATDNVRIDVIGKPKIMEFTNRTVAETKEVQITCRAFGRPPPEVSFRKQTLMKPFTKGIQSNDDRIEFTATTNNANSETLGVLTIRDVLRSDDGIYECIAKNKVASAYLNGHLTVEFPPSFALMENRTIYAWEQKPVNLTCIAESIPNATIRWTIGNIPLDDTDVKEFKIIGNGPTSTLSLIPRDRRYYKHYKCHAQNIHGERTHTIELREAQRPSKIQQARMSEITATTIAFNIVPPPSEPELPIRMIVIEYKEEQQPWLLARNKTFTLNSPYVLENLKPQTTYDFRFQARNDVGGGEWGANQIQTTPVRTSPNPPKVQKRVLNSDYDTSLYASQYEIHWIVPLDNGEPIDMYEIRNCEVKRISGEWQIQESTCKSETMKGHRSDYWLKDLTPDTFYQADVKAHNAFGYGKPGVVQFKTARESSGSTVDYSIISAGDTSKPIVCAIVAALSILFLTI
ncbi:hypothetical protein PV326_005595 [Microctonus aethiopoides]|nr:hypothetical protein PV326_005595 [Microctonus aethiopoides]